MKKLKVNRYLQSPGHCAVAAISTAANYYDPKINYEEGKKIAVKISEDLSEGLDSGEMARLLNTIGFNKVTLISSNVYIFDYSWDKLKRKKLVDKLKISKSKIHHEHRAVSNSIYKWLKDYNYDNNIIIDYNFGRYIRDFINKKKPVVITFNWTKFFKFAKEGRNGPDPIKGELEEHAVVVYGYNDKGAFICDSHHDYYKYKLKKYRKGSYIINWENLMSIIEMGDVFLPDDYVNIGLNNG